MSNRTKAIIAGVIVIILIILVIFFLPRPGAKPANLAANTGTQQQNSNSQSSNTTVPAPVPIVTPAPLPATPATVAQTFVTRFGSYSTQSQGQNLVDVLPLATSSYQATLTAQINALQAAPPATTYYGVSTRVVSTTVKSEDTSSATLSIVTQRDESKGSVQSSSVSYQTIVVTLVKVGTEWKVDSANWQS